MICKNTNSLLILLLLCFETMYVSAQNQLLKNGISSWDYDKVIIDMQQSKAYGRILSFVTGLKDQFKIDIKSFGTVLIDKFPVNQEIVRWKQNALRSGFQTDYLIILEPDCKRILNS